MEQWTTRFLRYACVAALVFLAGGLAQAQTSINDTNRWAHSPSVGWINFQGDTTNGAVFENGFATGFVYSSSIGWINLGGGPLV